jgi:hypothetical protein
VESTLKSPRTVAPSGEVQRASHGYTVLELPGLYGPFSFPEKLLQKIWLRREFDLNHAMLADGRKLTVVHPGKWNLLGGPDFKNARLKFGDGAEIHGDVELHLNARDWAAHRHAADCAYDGVVLHVVLFPPSADYTTIGAGGRTIPVLSLLPLLHHDLEEYATEDVVQNLANRPAAQIVELLGTKPMEELDSLLRTHAAERWRQKLRFAKIRIERLGWDEACHQTALEILGYRFNRAAMLRVAAAFPRGVWCNAASNVDEIFSSETAWSLQGIRPANHPRLRLRQYAAWNQSQPIWPLDWERSAARAASLAVELRGKTAAVRKALKLHPLRDEWQQTICGGSVTGTRFENLLCDGLLPLLSAHTARDLQALWFHWFIGDVPAVWRTALRELDVFNVREQPACHGLTQGLLGWLLERERSALGFTGHRA